MHAIISLAIVATTVSAPPAQADDIADIHSVEALTLAATHVLEARISATDETSARVRVRATLHGDAPDGVLIWKTTLRHHAQQHTDVKTGDAVVAFVLCETIPEDRTLDTRWLSPRRMVLVPASAATIKRIRTLLIARAEAEHAARLHRPKTAPAPEDARGRHVPADDPDERVRLAVASRMQTQAALHHSEADRDRINAELRRLDATNADMATQVVNYKAMIENLRADLGDRDQKLQKSAAEIVRLETRIKQGRPKNPANIRLEKAEEQIKMATATIDRLKRVIGNTERTQRLRVAEARNDRERANRAQQHTSELYAQIRKLTLELNRRRAKP